MNRPAILLPMLTDEQRKQVPEQVINELPNKITNYIRIIEGTNRPTFPSITDAKHF
jgi:hypothetical protein